MNGAAAPSPTVGSPGGEHRVLEPPGAEPLAATRLDALAELWDGELRLSLEAVVLSAVSHRRWVERLGSDPGRLTAAFAESVAERGGLGEEAHDATAIGTVAAVGSAHPHAVTVGERVAVAVSAAALPTFALPTAGWDGGRVVPVQGHAIVPAAAVTVPVDDAPAALAATLALHADLPTGLVPGHHVAVIGVDRPAGAIAVVTAAAQQREVTAVVASLAAARLARALGAGRSVIVAPAEPVPAAARLAEADRGSLDLVILADPAGAALAARCAPAVQVLTDPTSDAEVTARVLTAARAAGRGVTIAAGRGVADDRGTQLRHLVRTRPLLEATLRWGAGLGPRPHLPTDDVETT